MGNRLSWRRKKKVKVEAPAVANVPAEPEIPPPEVVLPEDDGSSFWSSAFGLKSGEAKAAILPLDVSNVRRGNPNEVSTEELYDVLQVSLELEQRLCAQDASENKAHVHFNLGLAYLALSRRTDACDQFRRAVTEDPTYGRAYTHLAHTLLEDAEPSVATLDAVVNHLELAIIHDTTEVRENQILLAEVYHLQGDFANALRTYSTIDRIDDEWQNTLHRAACHWARREFPESMALLASLASCADAADDVPNKRVVLADVHGLLMQPSIVAAS
ncbi:hypothetical protein SPRG_01056 [Saprolegnia parasitica CBS 223.65]|uniref:Uncharacterized protein n=1 Tax=Saprolegnia parasitica (strain CBS 223.65) TaxID=695850 RepID=A0A067CWU6_SAPPC|nr:hypothetical protein SPRG_01056 [Saprolegnia parasitica CBS 223.65]KDO34993.1 hypothetical protein SPRG_01056 [Saprolegnia parasitica CBS 223.65]|eukprot:XP_012194646.1 hypothetical protein SPRG_01056 [Saprolegnia parasitica CBS 223.65]